MPTSSHDSQSQLTFFHPSQLTNSQYFQHRLEEQRNATELPVQWSNTQTNSALQALQITAAKSRHQHVDPPQVDSGDLTTNPVSRNSRSNSFSRVEIKQFFRLAKEQGSRDRRKARALRAQEQEIHKAEKPVNHKRIPDQQQATGAPEFKTTCVPSGKLGSTLSIRPDAVRHVTNPVGFGDADDASGPDCATPLAASIAKTALGSTLTSKPRPAQQSLLKSGRSRRPPPLGMLRR
ncbi:hypothetical protein BV25DRAFT_1842376 [Artomyces pyxidatus]|uniref:Uncharacterized protein n=1 Tax=Artomyces pyxidatus TaxID=48021 RepID=A0ACB8SJF0_9AGAM|nr:hypothetical protein BV25DRAFT_1842376 [Artomyces pyxidatus]